MSRPIRYECISCEMSYWSSGSITECAHCGGFVHRAFTDVPSVLSDQRRVSDGIVENAMPNIISKFEELLARG